MLLIFEVSSSIVYPMDYRKKLLLLNLPAPVYFYCLFNERGSFRRGVVMLVAIILSASVYGQTQSGTDSLAQDAATDVQTLPLRADSLRQTTDTLLKAEESKIQQAQHRVDTTLRKLDIEQQATRQLSAGESKIREKTGQLKVNVNEIKPVKDTQHALGNIKQETSLSGPNAAVPELPGIDASKMGLPDSSSPSLPDAHLPTDKLYEVKALPSQGIDKVKSIKGVEQAGEHLGKAKEISGQAGGYQKDVEAISKGKFDKVEQLPQATEQGLSGTQEIKTLKEQEATLKQVQNQPKEIKGQVTQYSDRKFLTQKAKEKLLENSKDHFSHRTTELQAAQKKLAKHKRKYSQVNSQTGKLVKRTSLKGKPLKERLTGGFTLQIHQGPPTAFSLSPFLGYRLSKRWSSGIGGTYRLAFEGSNRAIWDHPVYGMRSYVECQPFKKFLLHAEYERLWASVPLQQSSTTETDRRWVEGVMAGVGKSYNVTKKIKGNVLFLRNFTYVSQGPYLQKWNIRFGFYL